MTPRQYLLVSVWQTKATTIYGSRNFLGLFLSFSGGGLKDVGLEIDPFFRDVALFVNYTGLGGEASLGTDLLGFGGDDGGEVGSGGLDLGRV